MFSRFISIFILLFTFNVIGQDVISEDLILDDPADLKLLEEEFKGESEAIKEQSKLPSSGLESRDDELSSTIDDLELLKSDLKDLEFELPKGDEIVKEVEVVAPAQKKNDSKVEIINDSTTKIDKDILNIGSEEKKLLELASKMKGRIENSTWSEIAGQAQESSYKVVKGDWLWKISEKLFGSGYYYAKIWSLNSYITNPHEIEPGMLLLFTTGSESELPRVSVANGSAGSVVEQVEDPSHLLVKDDFSKWGNDVKPSWIDEREQLLRDGAFVQYSTADTLEDLNKVSDKALTSEYEAYDPPAPDFDFKVPSDEYDQIGFDRNQRVVKDFKEGFHLNTFLSTNIVQDFGQVAAAIQEKSFFTKFDTIFLSFDENIDASVGDKFSIYQAQGKTTHLNSDRAGYRYTIVGSVQLVQKHSNRWEAKIIETSGVISRGDRITTYTPKIARITTTFNERLVESIIIGSFNDMQEYASYGDVVYIDRGRADGVEIGNVFEVYGFVDRGTERKITKNPTYKNGEITVITVTDNFSTALVTLSKRDFKVGDIAITKTKTSALKDLAVKSRQGSESKILDSKALDELDVELNLENLNDDILDKADQIKFTEDELAELERQEREKSIISDSEKDLKALERLEKEISTAEAMLNEARLDEDKLLENQDLNKIEKKVDAEYEESLEELEENFGKLYLDEELNDKDNPYGLTEFDIEEIDELLNVEGELEKK